MQGVRGSRDRPGAAGVQNQHRRVPASPAHGRRLHTPPTLPCLHGPGTQTCENAAARPRVQSTPPRPAPARGTPPPCGGPWGQTFGSWLLQEHVLPQEGEQPGLQDLVGQEEQQPQARVVLGALVAQDEKQVTQQDEGLRAESGGMTGHPQPRPPPAPAAPPAGPQGWATPHRGAHRAGRGTAAGPRKHPSPTPPCL